jgi:hypothetical protein
LDPGLVWTGVEKRKYPAPAMVRTLFHPTHGESLYRPLLFDLPQPINYRVDKIPPLDSTLGNLVHSTHSRPVYLGSILMTFRPLFRFRLAFPSELLSNKHSICIRRHSFTSVHNAYFGLYVF